MKIYDGTIRRATANIYIDPILFEEINLFLPYSDDLNGDGHPDILIPHSKEVMVYWESKHIPVKVKVLLTLKKN